MIKNSFLLFTLVLSISPPHPPLFSWGKDGHKIIANIAKYYISPNTELALQKITTLSLDQFCMLPDDMRSNAESFLWPNCDKNRICKANAVGWKKAHKWHYINTDIVESYEQLINQKGGNLFTALQNSILILQHPDLSEKLNALAWLVHLVGDLHQPLHLGHQKDRGGNDLEVNLKKRKPSNLHHLWDSPLVHYALYQSIHQDKEAAFIEKIIESHGQKGEKERENLKKNTSETIYNWIVGIKPLTQKIYQDYKYRGKEFGIADYFQTFQPDLEKQLYLAGYRLANLLNSIFS